MDGINGWMIIKFRFPERGGRVGFLRALEEHKGWQEIRPKPNKDEGGIAVQEERAAEVHYKEDDHHELE